MSPRTTKSKKAAPTKSGGAASTKSAAAKEPARGGYTVLARRYRSREFDELVGQEAIAQTLRNAIAHDRVAHAYLFTGTRGVGKTSMARLFAKALNASDDLEERDQVAAAILRGDDMDVIEIDGASNRGIDGARELIAAAGIAPARCRYKIYIIDEVHMLTTAAFNALLKTMEEPPSHVKFILCTTEPHAVPATIQSRCQRFDFRSISAARIAAHLRDVLDQESVPYDEQAVMQVARLANGSMRDGLSLLDRLIAGVGSEGAPGGSEAEGVSSSLDAPLLERMLGLPDQSLVLSIFDAIADGDAGRALGATDGLLQRGHTVEQAIETFIDHLRTLMLIVACGAESELIERSGEARDAAVAQAARFDAPGLVHMIALCEATVRSTRVSAAGRALFDALVVRLSLAAHIASIPSLLAGRFAEVPASALPPGDGATARDLSGSGGSGEKKKPVTSFESRPGILAGQTPVPPAPAPLDPVSVTAPSVEPGTRTAEASRSQPNQPVPQQRPNLPNDPAELWTAVLRVAAETPRDEVIVSDLEPVDFDGTTLRLRACADEPSMRRALLTHGPQVAELVHRAVGVRVAVQIEAIDEPMAAVAQTDAAVLTEVMSHPLVREASTLFDARVVSVRPRSRDDADGLDETPGEAPGEADT